MNAVNQLTALFSGDSPNSVWLYLGLSAIAIFGLIQSKRGKIVVFANYTDVLCTFLSLILPIALSLFMGHELPREAKAAAFLLPALFVAKATFAYNRSIWGFPLALLTKFFLVIVYILALVLAIAWAFSGERKKGQHESTHSAKQTATAVAGVASVTGVFALLVKLGLRSPGFVPLSGYFRGV